jgi:hypothetical protein
MTKNDWSATRNAPSPADAVRKHLEAIFVTTDADREALAKLMPQFRSFATDEYGAIATFAYEEIKQTVPLRFADPSKMEEPIASLQAIAKKYGPVSASCCGGGDIAFPGGNSIEDFLQNGDDFPETPMMAFDVGQNIMVAHTHEKNARGEPKLYFIDHEDGEARVLEGADDLTAAQVFLRLLVDHVVGGERYFENVGA